MVDLYLKLRKGPEFFGFPACFSSFCDFFLPEKGNAGGGGGGGDNTTLSVIAKSYHKKRSPDRVSSICLSEGLLPHFCFIGCPVHISAKCASSGLKVGYLQLHIIESSFRIM